MILAAIQQILAVSYDKTFHTSLAQVFFFFISYFPENPFFFFLKWKMNFKTTVQTLCSALSGSVCRGLYITFSVGGLGSVFPSRGDSGLCDCSWPLDYMWGQSVNETPEAGSLTTTKRGLFILWLPRQRVENMWCGLWWSPVRRLCSRCGLSLGVLSSLCGS